MTHTPYVTEDQVVVRTYLRKTIDQNTAYALLEALEVLVNEHFAPVYAQGAVRAEQWNKAVEAIAAARGETELKELIDEPGN